MKNLLGITLILISIALVENIPLPFSMKVSFYNLLVPVFLGSILPALLTGFGVYILAKADRSPWD